MNAKIEFVRVDRECGWNQKVRAEGKGRLIRDFDVVIDGEHRATFKLDDPRGRGYSLTTASQKYHVPIRQTIVGSRVRSEEVVKAESQQDFPAIVERMIAKGNIPTLAQIAAADKSKDEQKAEQDARDLEARKQAAFESRLIHHGGRLIEACKLLLAGGKEIQRRGITQAQINGGVILAESALKDIEEG